MRSNLSMVKLYECFERKSSNYEITFFLIIICDYYMVSLGRPYLFKFFKGCLPQILLGPFLNTLCHIIFPFSNYHSFLHDVIHNVMGNIKIYFIRFKRSHWRCSTEKGVLRDFAKLTDGDLCQSLFFNEGAGPRSLNLFKKRLRHRCFPVNFAKSLRAPLH